MIMLATGTRAGGGGGGADERRAGGGAANGGQAAASILVVSRNADTRVIFGAALRHAGFRVLELAEPERVLEQALTERPALVITDYPTRAGEATVTELLRQDARTDAVPILNATSHVFPEELARAAAAGVSASLPLPASLADLVREVRRLLARASRAG